MCEIFTEVSKDGAISMRLLHLKKCQKLLKFIAFETIYFKTTKPNTPKKHSYIIGAEMVCTAVHLASPARK